MPKNADPGDSHVVSLTIPAEPRWLALCRLVLAGLCQLGPIDDETLADLKLAVTEACSNSVRHAYGDNGSGLVGIRYELGADALAVEVVDAGQGFHFDRRRPEIIQSDGDLREDEMGLAIIHALVDEVEIGAARDGQGARIRFVKYLASGPNGAGGAD
jgi:serine/threonine-protein kinase RsbW